MWIDADLQLPGLNPLILVTAEIQTMLQGLVCWRFIDYYLQLLCLVETLLWTRRKIKLCNRFRDSEKFISTTCGEG